MSRTTEYTLSWSKAQHCYELSRSSTQELLTIIPDSPEWFAWLATISSFAFHGQKYSLTARRERTQRGNTYWYAYARINKKVRKKYLGRTAELDTKRLELTATLLHSEHPAETAPDTSANTTDRSATHTVAARSYKKTPTQDQASPTPLLTTKLSTPCPPVHLVLRTHLFAQLEHVLHYPLTLITASTGFGKTTLLSSWLHLSPAHALWISLESEDDNPLRFWSYFFTALNTSVSGATDIALPLLRLQQPPPLETILTLVINNLANCDEQIILVLDDYHVITNPAIHQGLTFLLDHQPTTLHLILATRVDPPLPLERLRMHGQMLELRSHTLCFTRDEVSNFLALATESIFSDEDIIALHTRTEGWIAGIQLFTLSLQGKSAHTQLIQGFTGGHRYIFDYLLREILSLQSQQVASFLLQTSILAYLHSGLCEAVTGQVGGQAMLEGLEQSNLFLQPLDDERQWYRYHRLFADVLLLRLKQTQPTLLPILYQRAIDWCEHEGRYHEAVTYALAIKDFERMARIIDCAGVRMVERGEVLTVQQWVSALPRELIYSRLRLCLFEAWRLTLNNKFADAQQLLQDYERQRESMPTHGPEEQRELLGEQLGLRSTLAMRYQRDFPLAMDLARQALTYYSPESMGRALLLFNIGTISWITGDQQSAIDSFSASIQVSQAAKSAYSMALSAQMLCSLLFQKGQLRRIERLLQELIPTRQEQALPGNGPLFICRGMLLREHNRPDEAIHSLRQGIVQCQQLSQFTIQIIGYITLARLYLGQANSVLARETLREADSFLSVPGITERWTLQIQALHAWCGYIQGNETEIRRWLQLCTLPTHGTFDRQKEGEYLIWVRFLRFYRRLDEAQTILHYLLHHVEEQEYTGYIIEVLVQLALIHYEQMHISEAKKRLMSALALAEPEGYLRVFLDEAPTITPLLVNMRETHAKRQFPADYSCSLHYLDTLVTFLGAEEQDAREKHSINNLLSEREMEVLQLLASGCSNREIAHRLVIALSTVKSHMNTIYNKLNVASRTQAIARAHELHLILARTSSFPAPHP